MIGSVGMDVHANGAEALRVWMARINKSGKELAAEMGVDPHTITRWRRGLGRPEGDARARLERVTGGGVPASVWVREEAA